MRRTITVLSLTFTFLIAGCDPGMTIRQAEQRGNRSGVPETPSPSNLTISVRIIHRLIGSSIYDPDVTVTNSSASSVTINAVELTAKGIVYSNKRQDAYPVVLASGQTQVLSVWFDLRSDVWKTFSKQSADLRVDYLSDGEQKTAHASIIGERLNY